MRATILSVLTVSVALTVTCPAQVAAQSVAADLRALHELAVYATVRVHAGSNRGTGWLLRQSQRPIIITNRHVVPLPRGQVEVFYYQGSERVPARGTARPVYVSDSIDLTVLIPEGDVPPTAVGLELEEGDVVRGQRVVLGGSPHGLLFQTTEGVVSGHLPEHDLARSCGIGRNCVVVDAASFAGSSGGPAINSERRVVGMLWGGPDGWDAHTRAGTPVWLQNPAFGYLVHARVLREELERLRARRR